MINMAVLQGLGDEITQNLAALEKASEHAIRPFRSDSALTKERPAVLAVMQRIQDTLDWAPRTLVTTASTMMDKYQSFPVLNSYTAFFGMGTDPNRPAWLTDDRMPAWKDVVAAYKPIQAAFIAKQGEAIRIEGERLARNAAFWEKVAKYSGTAQLEEVWKKLWEAVDAMRVQRASAKEALRVSSEVITQYSGRVPPPLVQKNQELSSQFHDLTVRARSALAPLGSQAQTAAGLDGLPLIIMGIGAAVVLSVTAAAWAVTNEFTSIQRQANANAMELLRWRDAQDAADFAAGRITDQQLQERRKQTSAAATEINEKQGAAIIGASLREAGSGLGVSLGTTLIIGGALYLGFMYFAKKQG